MQNKEIAAILNQFLEKGWVPEPQTKRILKLAGLQVPQGIVAQNKEEALDFARNSQYPLVAKVVSSRIVHKSDAGGVITGLKSEEELIQAFEHLQNLDGFAGMLLEQTGAGVELFLGGKIDAQFGPVILLGIGGTAVEVYNDIALRMAPVKQEEVPEMLKELKGKALLEGFRGQEAIHKQALARTVCRFSELLMDLEKQIESVDLNPLFCSARGCLVADARIMLSTDQETA